MTESGVELRKLASPESQMSGTGSFGHTAGNSFATETTLVPGDTEVGAMGPLYQTVPEAGRSHAQYKAETVRTGSTDKHYMTPGNGDEPNEYDIIADKQVMGKRSSKAATSTPPQVRLHSENILYSDQATAAAELRHATLTMDKQQQKYSGVASSGLSFESGSSATYCCGCRAVTIWMCFFVFLALVLAIVSLVMVIIVAFGVYEVPCSCDDSELPKYHSFFLQVSLTLPVCVCFFAVMLQVR